MPDQYVPNENPIPELGERYSNNKRSRRRSFFPFSLKRIRMPEDTDPMPVVTLQHREPISQPPIWPPNTENLHLKQKPSIVIGGVAIGLICIIVVLMVLGHARLPQNITASHAPTSVPTLAPTFTPTATIPATATTVLVATATKSANKTLYVPASSAPPGVKIPITLPSNASIKITATGLALNAALPTGTITCSNTPYTDANGNRYLDAAASQSCSPATNSNAMIPSLPVGMLIGRVDSGTWFQIGSSNSAFVIPRGGTLYLLYNDVASSFGDNSQGYNVTYTIQF